MEDRTVRRKGFEIGELEAEIFGALKSQGKASAGEMTERVKARRAIAYTTVSTTLERLLKKGFVTRETVPGRTGLKYVYSATDDPGIERRLVESTVNRLVDAFGPSVTSQIYDTLSEISPDELRSLKEAIEKRRENIESS